jgi:hypothetical protein
LAYRTIEVRQRGYLLVRSLKFKDRMVRFKGTLKFEGRILRYMLDRILKFKDLMVRFESSLTVPGKDRLRIVK